MSPTYSGKEWLRTKLYEDIGRNLVQSGQASPGTDFAAAYRAQCGVPTDFVAMGRQWCETNRAQFAELNALIAQAEPHLQVNATYAWELLNQAAEASPTGVFATWGGTVIHKFFADSLYTRHPELVARIEILAELCRG